MSELISKKYVKSTPSGATPGAEHVEAILAAPTTLTSTTTDVVKESLPSVTETLDLSIQSITDVITLLDSLPRVGGKLPDKVILALGKLHGALNLLRK